MSKKVFIIHGWSYNLDKWQAILPELKERNIEPVMLKVPGLTVPSDKVWDITGYVDWLHKQLAKESNPIVVGHSNGGRIALAYLKQYPNAFKQLILLDSAGLAHSNTLHTAKLRILYLLSKIGKPLKYIPGVRRLFYGLIGARDYDKAPDNMRATMQNMLKADNYIDLTKVTVPTTIIWGEKDIITPLKDGQKMQQLIPNAKLFVINGAKHAPQDNEPVQVADIISEAVQ